MMGAAWGVGALAPPALDTLVPVLGFRMVLVLASAMTLISAALAYFLPRDEPSGRGVRGTEMAAASAGD
jgi:hypothetical protein